MVAGFALCFCLPLGPVCTTPHRRDGVIGVFRRLSGRFRDFRFVAVFGDFFFAVFERLSSKWPSVEYAEIFISSSVESVSLASVNCLEPERLSGERCLGFVGS